MGLTNKISSSLLAAVAFLLALTGCRCEPEPDPEPEEIVEEEEEEVEEEDEELSEVFGIPMPPEYFDVRQYDHRVRVATGMDLDELEEFFTEVVVDFEVVRPGDRLRVVPLRSGQGRATASRYGGRRGHVVINYRRDMELDLTGLPTWGDADDEPEADPEPEEVVEEQVRTEPPPPTMRTGSERPDWLDDVQGEPVKLRTADGELLAPGARWGEPYTPPEGSPLDQERMRPNFGRPFGDWRAR